MLVLESLIVLSSFLTRSHAAPQAFASSLDNVYQLSAFTAPTLGAGNQGNITSTWGLTVDDTASGYMQTMDGFGAAVFTQNHFYSRDRKSADGKNIRSPMLQ